MKNMKKMAAGFIAAAMAMTMSLSAFAEVIAPVQNDNMYQEGTDATTGEATYNLVININDANQDQLTMMAYLVDDTVEITDDATTNYGIPAYSDQTIIALDQDAGANGFTTVPVDPAKLADGKSIVVKIGGSAGNVATYLVSMAEEIITYTVEYVLDGGTVTNPATPNEFTADKTIAQFFAELTDDDIPAKDGYTFKAWTDENGAVVDTGSTALMSTLDANADKVVTLTATYEKNAAADPVVVVIGDANGDGFFDGEDYAAIRYFNLWDENMSEAYNVGVTVNGIVIGDANGDGFFDGEDYAAVRYFNLWDENMSEAYNVGESVTID